MKDTLKSATCLLLLIVLSLTSCQKKVSDATDVLFDALDTEKDLPAYNIYYSDAPEYSQSVLSNDKCLRLYRDENMVSYAQSFACALGCDDLVWEIHVFVAKSLGDAGFIENALSKRLDIIQSREIYIYDMDTYEKRVASGKVFRDGKVVCLVICDNTEGILDVIKKAV
ncbi:MAG: hypothetical protein E7633_08250 [Ruminococcaceae bacterium]|nr:hypothetical protein [Oscillospiraceae bacterium]